MKPERQDRAYAALTQGQRERQEDSYRLVQLGRDTNPDGPLLLVVADGMGGQAAGDVASDVAIETFIAQVRTGDVLNVSADLHSALHAANDEIGRKVRQNETLQGMGTTLLAVLIDGSTAHWISVGDSILYLLREGKLRRLNADHSLAGQYREMAEAGKISFDEAESRGGHNQLRSVLMGDAISLIDQSNDGSVISLQKGDVVILASDGILTLDESSINQIVNSSERYAKSIAEMLVQNVIDAKDPRQDNATIVVYVHASKASKKKLETFDLLIYGNILLIVIIAIFIIIYNYAYIISLFK